MTSAEMKLTASILRTQAETMNEVAERMEGMAEEISDSVVVKQKIFFEDALEIHNALNQGVDQETLAAKYGVSLSRISQIKNGHSFPKRRKKD